MEAHSMLYPTWQLLKHRNRITEFGRKLNRWSLGMVLAFIPLLFAYVAASYVIFALPFSWVFVATANFLFPLWNTGYSVTIDEEVLVLILLIASLAFLSVRKTGPLRAGIYALRCAALSVIPLELLILASPTESDFFFVRVANFQPKYGILPWFTNEDLLIVAILTCGLTYLV